MYKIRKIDKLINFLFLCVLFNNGVTGFDLLEKRNYFRNLLLSAQSNLSLNCQNAFNKLLKDSHQKALIEMFDSSAKLPSGLKHGNFYHLGSFDSCYNIKETIDKEVIYGKYCLSNLPFLPNLKGKKQEIMKMYHFLSPTPILINVDPISMGIHLGHCIPSKCTSEDLMNFWRALMPENVNELTVEEFHCHSKDNEPGYSTWAILTIIFLILIGILVVLSTAYDIYLQFVGTNYEYRWALAFSAFTNGKELLKVSSNANQVTCLNGIRTITIAWIVLGHNYSLSFSSPIINHYAFLDFMNDPFNMWLLGGPLSVDTFFAIGGFLVTYQYLKLYEKQNKLPNLFYTYFHRYIRLTPAIVVVMLVQTNLAQYFGNGPLWQTIGRTLGHCDKYWWSTLLFIQNYMNPVDTCIGQSWYLSNDMQLFLFANIIMIPVIKWPKCGRTIFLVLIILGMLIPFYICYTEKLPGLMVGLDIPLIMKYMRVYYMQTYARFGPYVIGMVFGQILFKIKKNKLLPKKTEENVKFAAVLWLIVISGLLASLYSGSMLLNAEYNAFIHSSYTAFHRSTWAFFVCLVIVLCETGFGGPINTFLSLPIFVIIAKLSYSIYLIHYSLIAIKWASYKVPTRFSNFTLMHSFWGDFVFSTALSTLLYLGFELPLIMLERIFTKNGMIKFTKLL